MLNRFKTPVMNALRLLFLAALLVYAGQELHAQKNPAAKSLLSQAMADSVARKYGEAGDKFVAAGKEELKVTSGDPVFAANCFKRGGILFESYRYYTKANDAYYLAIEQFRKANKEQEVFDLLKTVAKLYNLTAKKNVLYNFPPAASMETITATRSIDSLRPLPEGGYEAIIDGGINDGLYEGADADVLGKHRRQGEDRANRPLGSARITAVYPNYSKAIITLINPADTFYNVYAGDMVSLPIRFPKLPFKDIFLEVSLLNIRFVDNYKEPFAHTRTLMYHASPRLEQELYDNMLMAVKEVYDMIRDDPNYDPREKITRGRFKGITWKEAMNKSTPGDLKAFLGFVRSFPGKYMGGTWKISETYATWLLNNAPPGSNELMDSLLAAKTEAAFQYYMKNYGKEIGDFFSSWQVDVQNMGLGGDSKTAFEWNAILQKIARSVNNPDWMGWTYFNMGRIQDEEKKYDEAIKNYELGKTWFEKGTDSKGLTFCINNLAYIYSVRYMYKESQQLYEQVTRLRLEKMKTDTSDDQKTLVARSYWGTGDAYYSQNKYPEAIEQYNKGLAVLASAKSLDARKTTAILNRAVGKSLEKMSEFDKAAAYYELEYRFQKALGDVEAQADALDNQAYLLSKVGKYREALNTYRMAFDHHLQSGEKGDAGFTMSNIGQVLWSLGKFDSAIDAHNKSISLRRETNNLKGEANSWKKIGGLYKESGDAAKSRNAYQVALDIYKKLDAKTDYAELLEDLASSFQKLKDYDSAVSYYNQAIAVYRLTKARDKEASVLSSLGNLFYDDLKYAKADEYYVKAEAIQKEINDRSGLMYTYINRSAVSQYMREDYREAIAGLLKAQKLAIETKSESNIAYCENKLGMLYSYMSEYDSALVHYDNSLYIYQRLEDKENQAGLYINYGYYYNYRGNFEKALTQFDRALQIGKEINNAYTIASAMYGLTVYYYNSGDFPKALKNIDQVLEIYKEKNNPWGIASVYLDQGNIRNQQGEFDEALGYYYKTDSLYKVLKMEKPRISVTNNIGTIYYQQKNFESAMGQFEKTLELLKKFNDDPAFLALVKANIGEVMVDQGKNKEAEKWLLESLEMSRAQKNNRQLASTAMIYGRLLTNLKQYAQAEKYFITSDSLLKIGVEKIAQIQLLESWGKMMFFNKQAEQAKSKLMQCVAMSDSIQYTNYAWKAYSTLADIEISGGNAGKGIQYLQSAIREVEKIKSKITGAEARKIFINDQSIVELYKKMVVILKKQGKGEEALVYMEKANEENIRLRLNNDDVTYDNAETNNALAKEKDLRKQQAIYDNQIAAEKAKPEALQHKEQIAQWEKMRSVTAEQYKSYVNQLKAKYPNLQAFKTVDPTDFMTQRRRIPADVAVVSYLVTDEEMSVFVVMKDTIFIKDIPLNKNLLQEKIRNFYTLHARSAKSAREIRGGKLSNSGNEPVKEDRKQLAQDLYDVLITPVISDLQGKQRVAIVPSGFLCFVPFDALMYKSQDGSLKYFSEQKQLFYVNKIATVTSGDAQPLTDFKVVAVGNADKSLPNAEEEVNELKSMLPQTVVYVRDQATKKNVLGNKGDHNILHLATHGVLDYGNAENSYLVLASDPGNNDNGRWTIEQIQQNTDIDRYLMVILSACETAVIREVAEGWPISTASAFIEMGVPTVVATLWQVDDKATRILVKKFYENLKTMDKLSALQQAQLYLKSQPGYEDPYYWAPFQLIGFWK